MDGSAEHTAAIVRARRALRYKAQSHARHLLTKRARAIHPESYPSDAYRTAGCKWSRIAQHVEVWREAQHGSAHYHGIATCGSVWACPICAAKIQERRRAEIEQAMTWANDAGLAVVMVTLTFPHTAFDQLRDLLAKQADALGRFRRTRGYAALSEQLRNLFATYGIGGFPYGMASG
jgi:hypothetical protein